MYNAGLLNASQRGALKTKIINGDHLRDPRLSDALDRFCEAGDGSAVISLLEEGGKGRTTGGAGGAGGIGGGGGGRGLSTLSSLDLDSTLDRLSVSMDRISLHPDRQRELQQHAQGGGRRRRRR